MTGLDLQRDDEMDGFGHWRHLPEVLCGAVYVTEAVSGRARQSLTAPTGPAREPGAEGQGQGQGQGPGEILMDTLDGLVQRPFTALAMAAKAFWSMPGVGFSFASAENLATTSSLAWST